MFEKALDISEGCNWFAKICRSDLSYRTNMAAEKLFLNIQSHCLLQKK